MLTKLKLFLQDSKRELQQVNWPSRAETIQLTTTVIAISLITAVFLGIFDFVFRYVINAFFV